MTGNNTTNSESYNLTGHFLIAMPSLNDGFFNHAVIYICKHDGTGSFGVIINQETSLTLKQIFKEMKIESPNHSNGKQSIFIGGPVDQGRGFILHRPTGNWQSSLKVNNSVALTTSKDILLALADNIEPKDSIVALGYAGWTAGQIEKEIASNTWLNCLAEEHIIFDTPPTERWDAAAKLIGIDISLLSNDTGHA